MKRFHYLILAGALCAFLAVHFIWLRQDVRIPPADEAMYMRFSLECYEVAQEGVGTFLSWFYKPHYQPVFYPCLSVPVYAMFGTEIDVALIGVNALVMIVLVLSIYGIGCYLFDWRVGLIGALVAMFIPELVWQSRVFWTHWGMVGIVAASMFLLLKTEHFTRWSYSLLFGVVLGLAALTRVYLPFYMIAPLLWIAGEAALHYWRERTRNRTAAARRIRLQILNAGLALVIAGLLAGPFYLGYFDILLATAASIQASRAAKFLASGLLERRLWYLLHLPENASLLITWLVIGGTISAFWRRSRSALFLLWWFVGGSIALGLWEDKGYFYFSPLYAPIALLGVHWLFQLKRPLRRILLVTILTLSVCQFFLVSWSTPQMAKLSGILRLNGGFNSSRGYAGGHPRSYQTDYDYLLRHTVEAIAQDLGQDHARRALVSLLTGAGAEWGWILGRSTWEYYGRLYNSPVTFRHVIGADSFALLGEADYIVVLNRGVIPFHNDPYTRPLAEFARSPPPALMGNFVILDDVVTEDGTTMRILKRVRPPDLDEYKAVFYGVFQSPGLRDTSAYARYVRSLPKNIWCLAAGKSSMEPLEQGGVAVKPLGQRFQLDDFRIYSKALSASSIEKLFQEASIDNTNLIAHWRFDEEKGAKVSDEINNYRGRLRGASWTEGKIGSAPQFYGADDHVEITDSEDLDLVEETTISSWIRLNDNEVSNPEVAVIARKYSSEANKAFAGYAVYVWNDSRLAFVIGNGQRRVGVLSDKKVPSDSRWHHVAVTFSDSEGEVRFYVDGNPAGRDTVTLRPSANDGPLIIGGTRRGKAVPVEVRYPCNGSLNIAEHIFALKLKANKAVTLSAEVRATDGNDYLIRYLPGDGQVHVDGKEITYYLGSQYSDGRWHTIERNLEVDIYEAVDAHFEHVEYVTLSGNSYSVSDPEFTTGIPEGKEVAVEGPVGVREVTLESMQAKPKPPEVPVDPELGIAVSRASVIISPGFKFEKGEYIIDVVAKRESADGTYPVMTISLNDELAKGVPEAVDKFPITAREFKKYSTKTITTYVPRLLSVSVSVGDGEKTDPDENGVEDGEVWIKKILIRKIVKETDRFTNYTLYIQWQSDQLALVVEEGDRRVGVLSDEGLGSTDEWHHVALTFGMDYKVKFYIDGKLAGGDVISLRADVGLKPLMLGANVKNGSPRFHFNGGMDDLWIYNRALQESKIEELFRQGRGAVAKEGAEPKIDVVRFWISSEDGVQTSSAKVGDENVVLHGNWPKTAESEVGLKFDGIDDYVEIPELSSSGTITDEFTISAWVRLNEIGMDRQVLIEHRER